MLWQANGAVIAVLDFLPCTEHIAVDLREQAVDPLCRIRRSLRAKERRDRLERQRQSGIKESFALDSIRERDLI